MIESLHIENLGVIAEATLDPGAGLTALTGETGAGKTMAITSLELILGGKADPSKVRAGASMARVEGVFTVARDSPLLPTIDGVGGAYDLEDDRAVVVVSRHIPAKGRKGRSAAFLGGRRVPTSVLRDIARHLVSLHGQSDQIRLATGSQQRRALDAFAGAPVARALEAWRSAYGAYGEAVTALEEFDETSRDQARQRLALQALVGKVDAVEPLPGEDDSLREEAHRLENVESRFLALSQAAAHLAGSDAVETAAIDGLAEAVRALEGLDDGRDAAELASRLRGLEAEVNDIAATLADMAGRAEADPERLSDVYARRQALAELRRDLGMGADEAIRAADEARATLERLGDPQGTRERLREAVDRAEREMEAAGGALHESRAEAARALGRRVEEELAELALSGARFDISVEPAPPAPHGRDAVAFLLASHKGAPLLPLGEAASGGELSRIMLALEVCLAEGSREEHTFLFDEVDAGVGGRAALAVGKRLASLATDRQVIVVTHLPQVAAYAGTQAVVRRQEGEQGASTDVVVVDGEARLAELARMLSGNDSETARAHASELLRLAIVAR